MLYGDESGIMAAKEVVSVFRDREKELDRLNRQLLEEEETEAEYEEEEDGEETEETEQPDYDAYNGDAADVDLEEYSHRVYEEPKRGRGLLAVIFLLTAAVLVFLAYLLAKKEGLL